MNNYKVSLYKKPGKFFSYIKCTLILEKSNLLFIHQEQVIKEINYNEILNVQVMSLNPFVNQDINILYNVYSYAWINPFWNSRIVYLSYKLENGNKNTIYFKLKNINLTFKFKREIDKKIN